MRDGIVRLVVSGIALLVGIALAGEPARAAQATLRLDGGFTTVDQAIARNPGTTFGADLEIGFADWIALFGSMDASRWRTGGTSPYRPSHLASSDLGVGLRLALPIGAWRPYVDVQGVIAQGDIDGAPGLGAQAGIGIAWRPVRGPGFFAEARGTAVSDMEESSGFASGRVGVSFPLGAR